MSETISYTCGFLFRRRPNNLFQVLLVRKRHPEWQSGLMNGIGGRMNPGEAPLHCMMREFAEEAGYLTPHWDCFANERGSGYEVYFFRWWLPEDYGTPRVNDKDEELEWVDTHPWPPKYPVVGNLNWLVPLAMDPRPISCETYTQGDIRKIKTW